jgi:hypothetical protein
MTVTSWQALKFINEAGPKADFLPTVDSRKLEKGSEAVIGDGN